MQSLSGSISFWCRKLPGRLLVNPNGETVEEPLQMERLLYLQTKDWLGDKRFALFFVSNDRGRWHCVQN